MWQMPYHLSLKCSISRFFSFALKLQPVNSVEVLEVGLLDSKRSVERERGGGSISLVYRIFLAF